MRIRWQMLLAVLIIIIGFGGQLAYDFYYRPFVLAKPVVKVRVPTEMMDKNHKLTKNDLYMDKVTVQDLPKNYLGSIDEALGKITNVELTNGTILTKSLVDVDDLQPKEKEGIFAIPKAAIYGINGSLRSRDVVNIYLIEESDKKLSTKSAISVPLESSKPFLEKVKVVHVRTDDNNDVKDTDKGNTNDRQTSTGKISEPELKLDTDSGGKLAEKLEQGYKLWIVRVQ